MLGYLRQGNKRVKAIWLVVTIATVFTFLIGFSFFGSMGRDSSSLSARTSGAYGRVNGVKITRAMWQNSLDAARENYKQRYGSEPVDRDLKSVEQQAWHNLVTQQLFAAEAQKAGLKATDKEVVVGMQTNPPSVLLTAPAFQTDGKFDPAKYQAAMRNPNVDWSPFEEQLREELPVRKLQEGLMSSLKLSEGELRETFRDRYERMSATILQIPPADTGSAPAGDAPMQAAFEKYRTRMASPARTQLEILAIPVQFSPEELKAAMDLARGYYERALHGEDFAQLAKDYSEGPNAGRGGVIDRWMNPGELGAIGQTLVAHKPGEVIDPYREGSSVMVFKILDPASDTTAKSPPYPGAIKLAQILVKVHPGQESIRDQYDKAVKIAARAKAAGLGRAATEAGLATQKTGYYDGNNTPPQLYATPEAADWGLTAVKGAVSPVFQSPDMFIIAQVAAQHAAGPPTKDEVADQLKQIADVEARVDKSKPRADAVAQAVARGQSLEDAAKSAGLAAPFAAQLTRAQPDQRLMAAAELQGALWGAKPGKVVGPVRTPAGWFFGRVDAIAAPPDSMFNDQLKGQITTEILQRRQRSFFEGFITMLRGHAKVQDNRAAFNAN